MPNQFNETSESSSLEGETITVDTNQVVKLPRMYMQPSKGDRIGFAPYYCRIKTAWTNADGTPAVVNGTQLSSDVYVGIIYDEKIAQWRDISGLPATKGANRKWPYESAYFHCTTSFGEKRFLQAFREGSTASSIIYDITKIGEGVFPEIEKLSSFDEALLVNPKQGALWNTLVDHVQAATVTLDDAIIQTKTNKSVSSIPNEIKNTDTGGTVMITIKSGPKTVSYNVSENDVYKIIHQLPDERITVKQPFLAVPVTPSYEEQALIPATSTPASTPAPIQPTLPSSFAPQKQFVATTVGLVLADYYLKAGSHFIALEQEKDLSGAMISNRFKVWDGIIDSKDPQSRTISKDTENSSILLDAEHKNLTINGFPLYATEAQCKENCYFGSLPTNNNGTPTSFVIAAHAKYFQGRIPVRETYFQGQVSFYMTSLPMLKTIMVSDLAKAPYSVYPLAQRFTAQRKIGNLPADDNFIPVSFKSDDDQGNTQSWYGMIALKTDFFKPGLDTSSYKNPQQYYKKVPSDEKFQFWYTTNNKTAVQISNDFAGTTIDRMDSITLSDYDAWPQELTDLFKNAAKEFVGYKQEKKKAPGFFSRLSAVFKPSSISYS